MARPNLRATDRSYFHEREKSRYMQRFLVARQRNDDLAEGGTINLWADGNYGSTVDQPTNRLNFRFAEPRRIPIPSTLLSIERAEDKAKCKTIPGKLWSNSGGKVVKIDEISRWQRNVLAIRHPRIGIPASSDSRQRNYFTSRSAKFAAELDAEFSSSQQPKGRYIFLD